MTKSEWYGRTSTHKPNSLSQIQQFDEIDDEIHDAIQQARGWIDRLTTQKHRIAWNGIEFVIKIKFSIWTLNWNGTMFWGWLELNLTGMVHEKKRIRLKYIKKKTERNYQNKLIQCEQNYVDIGHEPFDNSKSQSKEKKRRIYVLHVYWFWGESE